MSKMIEVLSHVEMDIRRPNGKVETVTRHDISVFSDRDFSLIKAATAKAGRGECLAYRCVTKMVVDTVSNNPSRIAELNYISEHNAIARMASGGEKCDQIGVIAEDKTPSHKTDF